MKKTNFMMALALAAVTLFATSCSEESLDITQGPVNTETIVLPAPTASISVTVVDLEAGKIVGNVTSMSVEVSEGVAKEVEVPCPENDGYTVAAPIKVQVPALSKGQAINIPVTFYVATLESALEEFLTNVSTTITPVEGEEADVETISLAHPENEGVWVNGSYANETDKNLIAFENSPLFHYDYKDGFEFAKEVEEAVESKAAATTILDLIKSAKFTIKKGKNSWNIAAWSIFTVKKIEQEFYLAKMKLENKEMGESVEFIANVAGEITFSTEAKEIEIDHNLGHEDINNGHVDNSHNGHGHGNSNNAGGGIGGNEGE